MSTIGQAAGKNNFQIIIILCIICNMLNIILILIFATWISTFDNSLFTTQHSKNVKKSFRTHLNERTDTEWNEQTKFQYLTICLK